MGDWPRLAHHVRTRRGELGMTQRQLAARSYLSLDRIQAIETARLNRYRPRTLAAVEQALGWDRGSIEAILTGTDRVEPQETTTNGHRVVWECPTCFALVYADKVPSHEDWHRKAAHG